MEFSLDQIGGDLNCIFLYDYCMQKNMIEEYLSQANVLKNKIGIFKLENFILILILFKTYYQDILLLKEKSI